MRISVNMINQIGNAITEIGAHEHRMGDSTKDRCRPKPATQASAISLAVAGHHASCAFLTGIGTGNVSTTRVRGTAWWRLPR